MGLPPAEKLSLAVRKNVRDEWDNNRADLEKQLSDLLGTAWTIDITPNAIWPYHNDGYAKDSLGSCIKEYVEGAISSLKYIIEKHSNVTEELNTTASGHRLTLEVDESERFSYCGCDIQDGVLRLLFRPQALGTNIGDCISEKVLFKAFNAAPGDKPLSFHARHGIKSDYESGAEELRQKIAGLLNLPDVKLVPNFEDTFAKLKASPEAQSGSLRDDWEECIGAFTLQYFEGLEWQLNRMKVKDDEMVREGVLEAVEKGEMAFRIVDKLKYGLYNEVVIEDGVLYLQTVTDRWGSNIGDAADKLMDQL